MHPAFSVIFLTTLIGAGQGLFMALVTGQVYSLANLLAPQDSVELLCAWAACCVTLLLVLGLVAAVFHLGKPSYFLTRAWRGMSQWRTSWLSRELIALPVFTLAGRPVWCRALLRFYRAPVRHQGPDPGRHRPCCSALSAVCCRSSCSCRPR